MLDYIQHSVPWWIMLIVMLGLLLAFTEYARRQNDDDNDRNN